MSGTITGTDYSAGQTGTHPLEGVPCPVSISPKRLESGKNEKEKEN